MVAHILPKVPQSPYPLPHPRVGVSWSKYTFFKTCLYYPPTKSEEYSFGVVYACVRPSIPSVRPHFLSVWNQISVPTGPLWFIVGTNDKYHGIAISNKFGRNRPLITWVIRQLLGKTYISFFVWWSSHFIKAIIYSEKQLKDIQIQFHLLH